MFPNFGPFNDMLGPAGERSVELPQLQDEVGLSTQQVGGSSYQLPV